MILPRRIARRAAAINLGESQGCLSALSFRVSHTHPHIPHPTAEVGQMHGHKTRYLLYGPPAAAKLSRTTEAISRKPSDRGSPRHGKRDALLDARTVLTMTAETPGNGAGQRTVLGGTIPDTAHAVSVSLPTWRANVGYEEGHDWVVGKMKSGYPRFFIHPSIQSLADAVLVKFATIGQSALLFPTAQIAQQALEFMKEDSESQNIEYPRDQTFRALDLVLRSRDESLTAENTPDSAVVAVLIPSSSFDRGKSFWQHSGEGISSRRAEFLHQALLGGYLIPRQEASDDPKRTTGTKGPRRYQKATLIRTEGSSPEASPVSNKSNTDYSQFIEERFGRNLDLSLANQAKHAIRRRISGSVNEIAKIEREKVESMDQSRTTRLHAAVTEEDVYLYPSGMSAIFNSHRILKKIGGERRCVMFGFPYIDTLKILEKFGPGALFYGNGRSEDLDDLERRCVTGEKFLALYCEFPGNPLLKTPNLRRIRQLGDQHGFAVVIDETIGNFLNVNVLPQADIVVSSLTKVFSGDSNVMGGSLTLNPKGSKYQELKKMLATEYKDNYWPEDAIYMERNSRDFLSRNERINSNADAICTLLKESPLVKRVYYPKFSETRSFFDEFKNPKGGYGGLFSVTFHAVQDAHVFFDALDTEKGPSLGTNFTLSCPFVILAHYNELDWAAQFGVEPDLVRVSVGLEDTEKLVGIFKRALDAVQQGRRGERSA